MRYLLLAAFVVALGGCGFRGGHGVIPVAPKLPTIEAPLTPSVPLSAVQAKERELAEAKAEVAQKESELSDLRLAPLRTSLVWAEGISLLGILAGAGLAAAALFWGLGFTWKIPAGIATGFAGVLIAALTAGVALNHVGWLIGAVGALGALGVLWLIQRHMTLAKAARLAWDQVPDTAPNLGKYEALLDKMVAK